MNTINPEQSAYIAAIIDGEGWISIGKYNHPKVKRGYTYYNRVSVASTNYEVIDWLSNTTGVGKIYNRTNKNRLGNKPQWMWVVGSNDGKSVLEYVQPYMKVKQLKARISIDFQEQINHGARKQMPDSHHDKLTKIFTEFKSL